MSPDGFVEKENTRPDDTYELEFAGRVGGTCMFVHMQTLTFSSSSLLVEGPFKPIFYTIQEQCLCSYLFVITM